MRKKRDNVSGCGDSYRMASRDNEKLSQIPAIAKFDQKMAAI